jgi:hypothetical protein
MLQNYVAITPAILFFSGMIAILINKNIKEDIRNKSPKDYAIPFLLRGPPFSLVVK